MKKTIAFHLFLLWVGAGNAQMRVIAKQDSTALAHLTHDFITFDRKYEEKKELRTEQIKKLAKQVFAAEAQGHATACSHQILFELISLIVSADFRKIDGWINDLKQSLGDSADQRKAGLPDPLDGSYGACYREWFLKVNKTYDYLEKSADKNAQARPLPAFLDKVNTPGKLAAYLHAVALSDVRRTGIDHEREFNDMLSTLTQMIIRGRSLHYRVDSSLKAELLDLIVNKLRNPVTGWWGESYIRGTNIEFVDNLSITFHVVSYLEGKISRMDKVMATTLAVKNLDYPVGWLWQKHYWNHNNMDVVTLFKYGWRDASDSQRSEIKAEIHKMLTWCLQESLQPDGSFTPTVPDGSVEEAEAYGVDFLDRIGYFDKTKRFWTTEDFPDSDSVRKKILTFVNEHANRGGAGGNDYDDMLKELNKGN